MVAGGNDWYLINNVDELDSPVLVIYLDRAKENIQRLINGIDDVNRLRPHVKTHKSLVITKLLLDAGITKFKCATIAEAEMLAQANCNDILLAYQPFGPKLKRFIKLQQQNAEIKFSCLVDNFQSAVQMSEFAKHDRIIISVYIDLNVGMDRTGITPDKALELYLQIVNLPNIKILGLHAYDGHIHEVDLNIRSKQCNEIYDEVADLKVRLAKMGFSDVNLIMGGSPSFPIYAKISDVECSPGTFIYWDINYQEGLPEQDFLPAALVIGRIISIPTSHTICVDIGHKSIASENDLSQRIKFLNAPNLKPISQSEEHLVVGVNEDHTLKIGDVLYGLPFHVCPTCALYESATIIQNGETTGKFKIDARDRQIII